MLALAGELFHVDFEVAAELAGLGGAVLVAAAVAVGAAGERLEAVGSLVAVLLLRGSRPSA